MAERKRRCIWHIVTSPHIRFFEHTVHAYDIDILLGWGARRSSHRILHK